MFLSQAPLSLVPGTMYLILHQFNQKKINYFKFSRHNPNSNLSLPHPQQMKHLLRAVLHPAACLPLLVLSILLLCLTQPSNQSIGYFESYGWPSYGIVKPFWLQPFSSYPTTQTSGYSRSAKTISAGVVKHYPGMNSKRMGFMRKRRR